MPDARFLNLCTANVLVVLVGVYPYFHHRNALTRWYAKGSICMALWALNEALAFVPLTHETRLVLFRISYIFAVYSVWNLFCFGMGLARVPVSDYPRSWKVLKLMGWINMVVMQTPWFVRDIHEFSHPFVEVPGPAYPVFILFFLWFLCLGVYCIGLGYKRSTGHERQQLKYAFFGTFIFLSGGLLFFAGLYIPQIGYSYFYFEVLYVALLAYAIVAHQLLDITIIIRKTFEYSLITGTLAGVYIAVVTASTYVLDRFLHTGSKMASIFAAIAVTLLFNPLRLKIQAWVDRKFFRETVSSEKALGELSDNINATSHAHDIAQALLNILETTLHPKAMNLYLRRTQKDSFKLYTLNYSEVWPLTLPADYLATLLNNSEKLPGEFPPRDRILVLQGDSGPVGYLILGEKKSEARLSVVEEHLIETALSQAAMAYEQTLLAPRWSSGEAQELLADVARGFVHEIKTPLSNINLPAQATFLDLQAIEDQKRTFESLLPKFKDRLKFIMTQAVKASERIDAIREFAALEDTRLEAVDLSLVLKDCAETLRPLSEKAGVQVEIQAPNSLALVLANPKHLDIVFSNLLKNAIEAVEAAQRPREERRVVLSINKDETFQEVSMRDSGTGIKEENLPHLFDRTFTTKGASGTGVGLYLTRQLVESLGGKIAVTSQEKQGTTFTIRLPSYNPQKHQSFHSQ